MQRQRPEALDLGSETAATRRLYGLDDPTTETSAATACSPGGCSSAACASCRSGAARAGRRTTGTTTATSPSELPPIATGVDRPIAGLLRDLKARGLLEDTLVVWSTEFGRQPFTQGADRPRPQRRHLRRLAGRRRRQGRHRPRRERRLGLARRHGPTYCYDLHATILHLLGIDHTRLTFRHNGIDRRLTDVHGQVIKPILA